MLVPVSICSLALSMVTALVTVRLVLARVKARSFKVKVVIEMVPAPVRVVGLVFNTSVVGAVKLDPDRFKSPFNDNVLPVQLNVPPDMVVPATSLKVMVPAVLVMAPLEKVGAAVKMKLLVPVMICSLALSKVTALVTVKVVLARVRARSFKVKVVAVKVAALVVKVALLVIDRLVGAVKAAAVVFRSPFKTRVLPVKSRVPPPGTPFKVIVPPVLVI